MEADVLSKSVQRNKTVELQHPGSLTFSVCHPTFSRPTRPTLDLRLRLILNKMLDKARLDQDLP